ncbi:MULTISPECIES: YihY/virulence factor BrkB family protein [unclassified Oleiphilus]|uniref:YihY/virulence factor BrkB family protein n=2 Tax=Oleiphilus TaxID=141450 RepID=UPI000ABBC19E|nr:MULTISPECIES: YihY/virulence factor BrkB family protein [unclassified Oleiphilus]
MKNLLDQWKDAEAWLLASPKPSMNPLMSLLRDALRILYVVIRDIATGQITLHAMSLVYTTILSIVPMLALSFSVLKAFNVQDRFTPMLYSFLEPMGAKGIEIHNSVLSFVDNMKVGVLGFLGFIILFYTVISLIQKIEKAFNTIWFAPELRSLGQRFSNYLIVVLVGPVLVVAAISLTASTMNSSLVQSIASIEPFGTVILMMTKLMPFFMIILTFTMFYILMPNTRVNFKSALVGGVVGGSAWQASSILFTAFVVNSSKYDAIYSGFAVGILLLIWLYVNWLILLLGSSIAFYHQHESHITKAQELDPSPEVSEKVGLDIMVNIARRFESTESPVLQVDIEHLHTIPAVASRKIIDKLISGGLLIVAGEKADMLVPGHSTDQISVAQILQALRGHESMWKYKHIKLSPEVSDIADKLHQDINKRFDNVLLRDLIKAKQINS